MGRQFSYQLALDDEGPVERGEIEARDEDDARRLLRLRYWVAALPESSRIIDKAAEEAARDQARRARLRRLLAVLSRHHLWLQGDPQGVRATLNGQDLRGVSLKGADLHHVDLAGADLSGADLSGADLGQARLTGAVLVGADLRGANLAPADLADADLHDADLTGAELAGADLARAHLVGVRIEPEALHRALGARPA